MTAKRIGAVTFLVRDYDEAIVWFRDALDFELVEDTPLGGGKRWVLVAPGDGGTPLLLAEASTETQRARIGDQSGGRVAFFLHTDDFSRDHARMRAAGVVFRFCRPTNLTLLPNATMERRLSERPPDIDRAPPTIWCAHVDMAWMTNKGKNNVPRMRTHRQGRAVRQ